MKRALVIALLLFVLLSGAGASSSDYKVQPSDGSWYFGLSLGTEMGVDLKWQYGNFDIFGGMGYGLLSATFSNSPTLVLSLAFSYKVIDIFTDDNTFIPFKVGLSLPVSFKVGSEDIDLALAVMLHMSVEYILSSWPVSFFARIGLGVDMNLISSFYIAPAIEAVLGVHYIF